MASTDGFFTVVISVYHPLQIELTSILLQMLSGGTGFSWQSENCVFQIMDGLNQYKETYQLTSR
jgi:hypothetical protein